MQETVAQIRNTAFGWRIPTFPIQLGTNLVALFSPYIPGQPYLDDEVIAKTGLWFDQMCKGFGTHDGMGAVLSTVLSHFFGMKRPLLVRDNGSNLAFLYLHGTGTNRTGFGLGYKLDAG